MTEEQTQKLDIAETKELLSFVLELVKAITKSLSGGISIFDTTNFITPALLASNAIKGITKVPTELRNLDVNEIQELSDLVIKLFGDSIDDKKEMILKKSMDVAIRIIDLYLAVKS
jgi:hypothetical protein